MSISSVRQDVLKQIGSLSAAERARLSAEICRRWIDEVKRAGVRLKGLSVGIYRPLPGEVEPRAIEEHLRAGGARLHYPRMRPEDREKMDFVHVSDTEAEWKKGPYGFEQPHERLPAADPAHLGLIFVPGIAFGQSGERIGRGKGHFDRFVPQAPQAVRAALAFDFQLFPSLEQNSWDQPVHWILTEKREIHLAPAKSWLARS